MRRPDLRRLALAGLAITALASASAAGPEPAPLRFRAAIEIREQAPFVEMPLPPAVYAHVPSGKSSPGEIIT